MGIYIEFVLIHKYKKANLALPVLLNGLLTRAYFYLCQNNPVMYKKFIGEGL